MSKEEMEGWWQQLSPDWQQALGDAYFQHQHLPTNTELEGLMEARVLRLAGPGADFPNTNVVLTDLSGIAPLSQLEILVIIHHQVSDIKLLVNKPNLRSLFLNNNCITSLSGIENLLQLEQLYVQSNKLQSIREVERLVNLRELYVHSNEITSLDGITAAHSDKLERFYCKPNHQLKQKEILQVEQQAFVRCHSL